MLKIEEQIVNALDAHRERGGIIDERAVADVLAQLPGLLPFSVVAKLLTEQPRGGGLFFPQPVSRFLGSLARLQRARLVVDPCCGGGQIAASIAAASGDADVIGIARRVDVASILQRTDARVEWRIGDVLHSPEVLPSAAPDLVVSCPPFNARMHGPETNEVGSELRCEDVAGTLLLLCATRMAMHGRTVFVVTPATWLSEKGGSWRGKLAAVGLGVEACLSLPPGTFAPFTSIRTLVVSVVRRPVSELFVGELTASDEHNETLLENWMKHRSARELHAGRWIPPEGFVSLERLMVEERVEELGRRAGVGAVRLGDLVRVARTANVSETAPDVVLVPLEAGASRMVTVAAEEPSSKRRALALEVAEDRAEPLFLARYLNSELGGLARASAASGSAVAKLQTDAFLNAQVFLPDLATQRQVVQTATAIRGLVSELVELEERLWAQPKSLESVRSALGKVNHQDRLEAWLDTLPFPVATILWVYSTQRSPKERAETLLHFFEAYAAFWATVLLSIYLRDDATRQNRRSALKGVLDKQKQNLDVAGFGTWLTIVEYIAKEFRARASGGADSRDDLFRQAALGENGFESVLFGKDLLRVLRTASSHRNSWKGHSGIVGDEEAGGRLIALEKLLGELRSAVGERWGSYPLGRVTQLEYRNGLFYAAVERVMGTRTPFQSELVELSRPAESGKLHLIGAGGRDAIPVLPFVRVMASPKTALNACYFYNRRTKDGVRFVSYHYAEDAEVTGPFDDTAGVLEALTGG